MAEEAPRTNLRICLPRGRHPKSAPSRLTSAPSEHESRAQRDGSISSLARKALRSGRWPSERSYRRWPKRGKHWRIALWFREVTPAGGHSRNRHGDAAKLPKSRGPESAWRSLASTGHDPTPHCRSRRHLGALSAHHAPPLPAQSGRSPADGAGVLVLPSVRGEAAWGLGPRGVPHVDYGPELARERIAERVRDKQHPAWNKAKRTGMSFVGPRRVLRVAHTKRAKSYEVFGSLNPQFAAAGNRAAATEAVKRLRAFKAQYARALAAWTAGDRSACFPQGTWWMRVCHGARCGSGP